jgi:hypothetical protein
MWQTAARVHALNEFGELKSRIDIKITIFRDLEESKQSITTQEFANLTEIFWPQNISTMMIFMKKPFKHVAFWFSPAWRCCNVDLNGWGKRTKAEMYFGGFSVT